jgi:hypothetical protein
MPDFSQLLRRPAGRGVRPAVLPIEVYPGIIRRFEYGDQNRNKTPYVRYFVALTGWPESVPPHERMHKDADGNMVEIDLSRRQFTADFYLTDEAIAMLDNFLRSCGLELEGMTYEAVVPQAVGAQVLCRIGQYINEQSNETVNSRRLDNVIGTARGNAQAQAQAAPWSPQPAAAQ